MSGDPQKESKDGCGESKQSKTARGLAGKNAEKARLAAALRENLKRRKAQMTARRDEPVPE